MLEGTRLINKNLAIKKTALNKIDYILRKYKKIHLIVNYSKWETNIKIYKEKVY